MSRLSILGLLGSVGVLVFLFQNAETVSTPPPAPICKTVPGGNYNVDPETFRNLLVIRANIPWFRGILDLYKLKRERERGVYSATSEMGLKISSFKAAKAHGLKTVLSLKSPFLEHGLRVPSPTEDVAWLDQVRFLADQLANDVDIFVVGNEPIVETQDIDMAYDPVLLYNPMSRYYIRIARTLDETFKARSIRANKKIFMGSFNRLDSPPKRDIDGVQRMITFAKRDSSIDGVDLHIHVPSMAAAEQQLAYIRNELGNSNKLLIVTEFSLMWLFKQHLSDSLCFSNGLLSRTFCDHLRLEPLGQELLGLRGVATELEFINAILRAPLDRKISSEVFAEFFTSRPYLPADYMAEAYAQFNQYGVGMASYTFDQNDPNDSDTWVWQGAYTLEDTPTRLYPLFVPQAVRKDYAIPFNSYLYPPFKKAVNTALTFNSGKACPF